jgi:hypothetical protein
LEREKSCESIPRKKCTILSTTGKEFTLDCSL